MKKTKNCDLSTFENETFTFPIAKRKIGQENSDTLVPKKFIKLQEEKQNLKKDNVTLNKTVNRKTSCAKTLKYKYKDLKKKARKTSRSMQTNIEIRHV